MEETLKGNVVQLYREAKEIDTSTGKKRKGGGARLDLPKIRRNPYIEIIAVNTGCLNQCTYCKTKHARGDLGSYSIEEIVNRVLQVLDEGVMEIWLTSEDIGAYGIDIGTNIIDLLWAIVGAMESHSSLAMLRIGMTNPPYMLHHINELCRVLNHPRVYAFLHVPVQAGSTNVLEEMRRLYRIEDFELVCDTLLDQVPRITLATDVICGYPTESEADFEETIRILEKYRFPVLHISQFYPRPGTPAARIKRISTQIVKARSRRATAIFESYSTLDHFVGTVQTILVTESSQDGNHFVGHTKEFVQVLVAKDPRIMGRHIEVKITQCSKWSLRGDILEESLKSMDEIPLRIPKLIRVRKQMVALNSESEVKRADDQRNDGAILTSRATSRATSQTEAQTINTGSVYWKAGTLLFGLGVAVSIGYSPLKARQKGMLITFISIFGFARVFNG